MKGISYNDLGLGAGKERQMLPVLTISVLLDVKKLV